MSRFVRFTCIVIVVAAVVTRGGHVVLGGSGAAKQVEPAYVSLDVGSECIYCRVDWEG